MVGRQVSPVLFWIFSIFLVTSSSWAGQVVTDEATQWAKKALAEEKALRPADIGNTVAVLYFQNKSGQPALDPLQKGLALMLITDLFAVKGLQVLERIRIQALTEEMGLGLSGLVEPHTAPRVGRLVGARWVIGGEIHESSVRILSNLLDIQVQTVLGQPTVKGDLSDLYLLEKELLFELIKLLKIEVTPDEKEALRKPCSMNTNALLALFKGIDASDRGQYEMAGEFYETALKEDSTICVAKDALDELISLRLIGGKKRSRQLLKSLRDRTSLTDQLSPEDPTKRVRTPQERPPLSPQGGRNENLIDRGSR